MRKNRALIFAPVLFNFFALPTKINFAAKEMVSARRCRALAKLITIAQDLSFVALKTVIGQKGSTAARKNAKGMVVAHLRVPAGKMRVSALAMEIA